MAKIEKLNLKDLSISDLNEKLTDERSTLLKLKMSHSVSPIENPMKIRAIRRSIARIQTELKGRASETQSK